MTRKTEGWQGRLAAYIAAHHREPFVYGTQDCALFSFGAVAVMTGLDLAEGRRGRYTTLRGGIRILRSQGYDDHIALAAAHFPETTTPRPGDLAVVPTPDGPALGIVQGVLIYALSAAGMSMLPISAANRFFEV